MNSEEIWRKVVGWKDYSVSSFGRVRRDSDGSRTKAGIMSYTERSDRYPHVNLSDGVQAGVQKRIHIIVLEAFVGPCPAGKMARHLNDVKTDNRSSNLRWGTHLENSNDARKNGILIGSAAMSPVVRKEQIRKMVETRKKNGSFLGFSGISSEKQTAAKAKMSAKKKEECLRKKLAGIPVGLASLSKEERASVGRKIGATLRAGHKSGKYDGILFGRAAFTKQERHDAAMRSWETRRALASIAISDS